MKKITKLHLFGSFFHNIIPFFAKLFRPIFINDWGEGGVVHLVNSSMIYFVLILMYFGQFVIILML